MNQDSWQDNGFYGPAGTHAQGALSPDEYFAAKVSERMQFVQRRAAGVAKRLLDHREAFLPIPGDTLEMIDMIDGLAKRARALGCYLTPADRRYLAQWHAYRRFKIKMERRES